MNKDVTTQNDITLMGDREWMEGEKRGTAEEGTELGKAV